MSLELVDKIDQKTSKRYQKIGFNDLLLEEDEGDGVMYDIKPTGSTEDYVGMELENVMEHRTDKKKNRIILAAATTLLFLLISIAVLRGHGKNSAPVTPAKSHYESSESGSQLNIEGPKDNTENNHDNDTALDTPTTMPIDDIESLDPMSWPTTAPLPEFDICPPPVIIPKGKAVYHMEDLVIVPESKTNENTDEGTKKWEYSFSSMDISEEASIIAVGLSDFSPDNNYDNVGLVRVFAWACESKAWKQLGQDLFGSTQYAGFGAAVSSSHDGRVMAVSSTEEVINGTGSVVVYFLDGNHWDMLGSRIQNIDVDLDYYGLGTAIDLSAIGDTLAVLGILTPTAYIARVYSYSYNGKAWAHKGQNLIINVTYVDGFSFNPTLILSEDGDELAMGDPQFGIITYHYKFEINKWVKGSKKSAKWDTDDYYVQRMDTDASGNLVAFSACVVDGPNTVKVVDYNNNTTTDVYVKDYKDFEVSLAVDVSKDGQVVAVLASKIDGDDNTFWTYDSIGALAIISKDELDGKWKVVGKGSKSENLGVPGSFVSLSGDGTIAAVGSDTVIALYGISLNHKALNITTVQATNETFIPSTAFAICAPYQNVSANSHAGDLDKLPKQFDEHTLSIAMSADASIVAVGIDSFLFETRGLARVFAWNCDAHSYFQLGQDLFGDDLYDGFGQSVDLSNDGHTLVVGANQPPPGKTGYVDIYSFNNGQWKRVGNRLTNFTNSVEDIGREVRISSDGTTVAIHGSVVEGNSSGFSSSFIRVVEKVNGEWTPKGDDLIGSIDYDDYGMTVRIALSLDGKTLGVTGSYSNFMAKVYTFNETKKNWTEVVIPPVKESNNTDFEEWGEEYDLYFETYFDGSDIGLSDDGKFISIGGKRWDDNFPIIRVLALQESGNWTMAHNALDTDSFDVFTVSSAAISGDAEMVAIGASAYSGNISDQGSLFVSAMDEKDLSWGVLGRVFGRNKDDHFGARVGISNDGTIAAASSRKGYVSFFKTSRVSPS